MSDAVGTRGWLLNRSYESSGGLVAYDVIGSGPPVVLIHGTPFSSRVWRKIVPKLVEKRAVYVFDLTGYGASENGKARMFRWPPTGELSLSSWTTGA